MDPRAEAVFFEIHGGNHREGPGDREATRRAFARLGDLPDRPVILDIGCGPGQQTLDLAALSDGDIHAIDTHLPYLADLEARLVDAGLTGRVFPQRADMASLPYPTSHFDLIWAEGAIYLMGFAAGLAYWRRYVKPGGYLAVSELSWLVPHPPEAALRFWAEAYPAMTDRAGNIAHIKSAGYTLVDQFVLPTAAWWDSYYSPIEKKLAVLREKYAAVPAALAVIDAEQREIDLFRLHHDAYGYVFYIMRKPAGAARAFSPR